MGSTIGSTGPGQTAAPSSPVTESTTNKTTESTSSSPQPQPPPDPQSEARNTDGSKKLAMGMRGQNVSTGRFVQHQLNQQVSSQPVVPSPADQARKMEDAKQGKAPANNPATQFDPSKSAVQQGHVSLRPDVEHGKLPDDLKSKLHPELWSKMGTQQRLTLLETYSRMKNYGVWDQVKRVTGEKEHPEPHVKVKGHEFEAAGNAGGITFEAYDGAELAKKLKKTGHFGEDGKYIGALHKGQRSMREWSDDPRSLHISIGPGNKFDSHIDKVSPTNQPQAGNTKIDPIKGKGHHTTEVWPEKIRDAIKVPGVIVEGNIKENREGRHGAEVKVGVKVEVKGPVAKEKVDLGQSKPSRAIPVDQHIMEKINSRLHTTKNDFPTPIGFNPDEVPTKEAVASQIAAEIMEAARSGKNSIQLNLPQYLGHKGDQAKATATMREIGEMVRNELIKARAALPEKERANFPDPDSVRGMTITYGSMRERAIVSLMQ